MPAMKKLKLSIAAQISRAWPAPTEVLCLLMSVTQVHESLLFTTKTQKTSCSSCLRSEAFNAF